MTDRKLFYMAVTLNGDARSKANRAELVVLGAELEQEERAKKVLLATGLALESEETIPCPPPDQDN